MISPPHASPFTVTLLQLRFCRFFFNTVKRLRLFFFRPGAPPRGQPLRLAVQFCTPPRGGSEPQRLERGARSGSPHVAAALALARPGGLRFKMVAYYSN